MNKEIICPNCSQRIKILDTIGYDLYLENLKKEEIEIERLNNIINKSIEYINNLSNEPNTFGHYGIDSRCKNWLLNILKGVDKE